MLVSSYPGNFITYILCSLFQLNATCTYPAGIFILSYHMFAMLLFQSNADPQLCRHVIDRDNYEAVHNLVLYYQMVSVLQWNHSVHIFVKDKICLQLIFGPAGLDVLAIYGYTFGPSLKCTSHYIGSLEMCVMSCY